MRFCFSVCRPGSRICSASSFVCRPGSGTSTRVLSLFFCFSVCRLGSRICFASSFDFVCFLCVVPVPGLPRELFRILSVFLRVALVCGSVPQVVLLNYCLFLCLAPVPELPHELFGILSVSLCRLRSQICSASSFEFVCFLSVSPRLWDFHASSFGVCLFLCVSPWFADLFREFF